LVPDWQLHCCRFAQPDDKYRSDPAWPTPFENRAIGIGLKLFGIDGKTLL